MGIVQHGMQSPAAQGQQETALTPEEDVETRRQAQVDAVLQAGWALRYDPLRDEFIAAREMVTARTLDELLDAVEAED